MMSPNVLASSQKCGKSMCLSDAMCTADSTEWVVYFLFITSYGYILQLEEQV